ncbi:MraY family glycosyltransferase [Planctomycetota bacterium]
MEIVGIVTLLTSFIITLILTLFVRYLAHTWHFVDAPGPRKIHTTPIALGGGIAIFGGIVFTFVLGLLSAYFLKNTPFDILPAVIYKYLPGVFVMLPKLGIIFCGGLFIFLIGLVDDLKGLSAWWKLGLEVLVGLFLVINGISLSLFLESNPLGHFISGFITIIWIVGIINAFNMLDHMDGLCSGVVSLVSIIFLITALQTGQYFIACALFALIGTSLAFLIFNIHPASIFMGDTGSLFLGFIIAVLTILFTFYRLPYPRYSILTPLLVCAIPLFDMLRVVFIRLKNHRPLFQGDTNHFAHRLVALGMNMRAAVFFIYLITFGTGMSAVLLYHVKAQRIGPVLVVGQVIIFLAIFTLLEEVGRKRKSHQNK